MNKKPLKNIKNVETQGIYTRDGSNSNFFITAIAAVYAVIIFYVTSVAIVDIYF